MDHQRAVVCQAFGEPAEVLSVATTAPPACSAGELLVRAACRSVNPSDLLTVRGAYARATELPFVPGFEAVGEVVDVGQGVSSSWLGRRVLPLRGAGTWQQLVVAPVEWAIEVPDSIPDAIATQLYINPITVHRLLAVELALVPGDVVIVNAAGSACGRIAAQLARERGLRMVALVRNDIHTAELAALGAAAVVDAARGDVAGIVADLTGGRGARAALDAIGGDAGAALVQLLEPGATLVSYGLLSGKLLPPELPEAGDRPVRVLRYWLKPWVDSCTQAEWRETFGGIVERVERGALQLAVAAAFALADVAQAVRAAEAAGRRGKIVLTG